MTLFSFLLRNLAYFWRGNLAVLLGVLVGSTVLTGALFVGDSLQGSLREQTHRRLGWVSHAVVVPRFFRAQLSREVAESADARVSPAILLQATCAAGDKLARVQARGVTVLGVEAGFFENAPTEFDRGEGEPPAWVNRTAAKELNLRVGDRLTVQMQKPEAVPREAGLGKKDVAIEEWVVVVAGVLGDDDPQAAFNLRPELVPPKNVFVRLKDLQARLNLPDQANALFAAGDGKTLDAALAKHVTLDDWGLTLQSPSSRALALVRRYDRDGDGKLSYAEWLGTRLKGKNLPRYAWVLEDFVKPAAERVRTRDDLREAFARGYPYLALESKQLLLSPQVAGAALSAAKAANLRAAPTLVYLCRFEAGGRRFAGVAAALDVAEPWPLGPFLPEGVGALGDKQIVLLDEGWTKAKPPGGADVRVRFKPAESHGPAPDVVETFALAGYVSPKGLPGGPFLTPDFPGITDRDDLGAWELPFDDDDWKKNVSKEYGDPYWKEFRGTPKAFVTLARGKQLWGSSRFGELTSVRLAPPDATKQTPPTAENLDSAADRYRAALMSRLDPVAGGFVFDDVLNTGLKASQGGTPFGLLFLGFSFFLILSALLLVGLLYRLNLERRARQVGVLSAEGFSRSVVGLLLLSEGLILAFVGALLGLLSALLYSRLLVDFLRAAWPGGTLDTLLRPHAGVGSMGWGVVGTLIAAGLTICWVVWSLSRIPPRALLSGQTSPEAAPGAQRHSSWLGVVALASSLAGAGLLVSGFFVAGQEARAGTFFGAGMLFLTAGLCGVRLWMRGLRGSLIAGSGWRGVGRLGVRNSARHPGRSLLAVGLLASAVFLIVAVESFRRRPAESDGAVSAPDGGFALVAETDLAVIRDLNAPEGKEKEILDRLRARLRDEQVNADEADRRMKAARELLAETTIVALRARAGDDASCLNLYQPRNPRVLGVPDALVRRGGFVFDGSLAKTPEEKANPWLILQRDEGAPAFGEANTVTWMLKTGLGGTWPVADDRGEAKKLTIAGLLHDSVFQSSLLVSEETFLRLYPGHEGYHYFLIAPPKGREDDVKKLLTTALSDRGIEVTATKDRLAAFLAVENTYLSTFQSLGGLGLLLGSLGLAVVLLRAVWERRGELALLRALGYRRTALGWLVLSENAFLLTLGLVVGTASALLSILPQLARGEGSVPWLNLAGLFAGVLAVALGAAALATALTLRAPIVPALRRE